MVRSLRTLLAGVVDYAGLFPPTAWEMQEAVEEYARRAMGEEAWMLGRFIVPAARLDEFGSCAQSLLPGTWATSGYREMAGGDMKPWGISCLVPADVEQLPRAFDVIDAFNERHTDEGEGLARIETVELKATSPGFIDEALDHIPSDILPFFEVPVIGTDPRGYVAALAGNDAAAKVRCGGVTADLIPSSGDVAAFMVACASAGVPFKATAGLHHPVRAEQRLTYDDDPPRGVMHGFLNVFLASALARAGKLDRAGVVRLLEETDPGAFEFTEDGAAWDGVGVNVVEIAKARESFALSYGSCSFGEPVEDLKGLGLL